MGWTGQKCPFCKGCGESADESGEDSPCTNCGGTGDEWAQVAATPSVTGKHWSDMADEIHQHGGRPSLKEAE